MAELRFIVEHQKLAPARDCDFCVAARSHNYLHASFECLTEDWDEAADNRVAVFQRPELGVREEVPLDSSNVCLVPDSLLKTVGEMWVSLYGGSDVFITTSQQKILIREAGYTTE